MRAGLEVQECGLREVEAAKAGPRGAEAGIHVLVVARPEERIERPDGLQEVLPKDHPAVADEVNLPRFVPGRPVGVALTEEGHRRVASAERGVNER